MSRKRAKVPKAPKSKRESVETSIPLGPCPECGGDVHAVGLDNRSPTASREPGLIHTTPVCQRFMDMEVGDFATWMREVKEAEMREVKEADV